MTGKEQRSLQLGREKLLNNPGAAGPPGCSVPAGVCQTQTIRNAPSSQPHGPHIHRAVWSPGRDAQRRAQGGDTVGCPECHRGKAAQPARHSPASPPAALPPASADRRAERCHPHGTQMEPELGVGACLGLVLGMGLCMWVDWRWCVVAWGGCTVGCPHCLHGVLSVLQLRCCWGTTWARRSGKCPDPHVTACPIAWAALGLLPTSHPLMVLI